MGAAYNVSHKLTIYAPDNWKFSTLHFDKLSVEFPAWTSRRRTQPSGWVRTLDPFFITPSLSLVYIAAPLLDARPRSPHTPRDPQWYGRVSRYDDTHAPINWAASLPPASSFALPLATCKTAVSPPHAYRQCRQSRILRFSKSALFVYLSLLVHEREYKQLSLQLDHHLTFHNRRVELRYGCQFGQGWARKSVFDTWQRQQVYTYTVFVNHFLVPRARFERATLGLWVPCST